jgi:hypothetical protein
MGVLTPREACENLIAADRRNIETVKRPGYNGNRWADVIADCAVRLFEARKVCPELARRAEQNLRDAVEGWQ